MRLALAVLVSSTLVLTSCGAVRDSRLNPINWFGSSEAAESSQQATQSDPYANNPLIPKRANNRLRRPDQGYQGVPVATIATLSVERVPGGAVIRTTGVAASVGAFDVQLTPENEDELPVDGILSYRLEARLPGAKIDGSERARTVNAARFLTDQQLSGVRSIRVEGAGNARVTRRR